MELGKRNIELFFIIVIVFTYEIYGQGKWSVQNPLPSESYLLTVEPVTNNIIYAGGMGGTLLKSSNNGISWTVQKFEELINIRSICFKDSLNGWLLDSKHIYNTLNGGENWNEVSININTTEYYYLDIVCFEKTIYLSLKPRTAKVWELVNATSIILKSIDDGKTWKQLDVELKGKMLCSYFLNKNIGYIYTKETVSAAESFYAFYKTTDGGLTWIKNNFPKYQFTSGMYFVNELEGFIGKYKTTNGGETWENMFTNILTEDESINDLFFIDSSNGFAVCREKIMQTEDGGNTWIELDAKGNCNLTDIKFSKNGTGWIVGWACDILQKKIFEENWKNLSKGARYNLNDVFFVDENNGWSVGDNGCILHTSNGGETWEKQNSNNIDNILYKVKFLNKLNGWIAGYNIVLYTEDGGINWRTIDGLTGWFVDIAFFDNKNGILIEHHGYVFNTTDGGATWSLYNERLSKVLTTVEIVNENEAWIGGWQGLGYTDDKGKTIIWNEAPGFAEVKHIHFVSDSIGYLSNDRGDFIGTYDGAKTWQDFTRGEGLNYFVSNFFAVDSNNIWVYFGIAGGYLKQIIANKTLITVTDMQEYWVHTINSIFFLNSITGWAVGDGGTIMKYTNSDLPPIITKEKQVSIFPNPFDKTGTNISFLLRNPQNVKIQVYNILGAKVEIIYNGLLNKGVKKLFWKPSNIASGLYFIFIQCNEFNQAQKCILISN